MDKGKGDVSYLLRISSAVYSIQRNTVNGYTQTYLFNTSESPGNLTVLSNTNLEANAVGETL